MNGFLGFNFSGEGYHNVVYGLVSGAGFFIFAGLLFWNARRKATKAGGSRKDWGIKMGRIPNNPTTATDIRATV